jgi:hypothetical protein
MDSISNQIRVKLKRLCPYVCSYIPNSVRQNARHIWVKPYEPDKHAGWKWVDGSGIYQCELILCDMDAQTIDPANLIFHTIAGG